MTETLVNNIASEEIAKEKNQASSSDSPVFVQERLFVPQYHVKAPSLQAVLKQEWKPKSEVELQIKQEMWEKSLVSVNLVLNFVVKNQGMTALSLEMIQSGLFRIENLTDEQKEHVLNAVVPDSLFPYLRKAVADASLNAGLPVIWMTPMNFTGMYYEQKRKKIEEEKSQGNDDQSHTGGHSSTENTIVESVLRDENEVTH